THRSRVDVLVAAEPGEAIGKGDDYRRHALFPDQPVEPLRQVLAEACPVRMREPAAGEAYKIHQERQSSSVISSRDIHIDDARRRITENIALQSMAFDRDSTNRTRRSVELAHPSYPGCC